MSGAALGFNPGVVVSSPPGAPLPPPPSSLGVTLIVPNGAAFATIDDTVYGELTRARIGTLKDDADLLKTSTLTVDNITVWATQSGAGRWVRRLTPNLNYWQQQPPWFIDATNGNDENPGNAASLGSALKTWAELMRRLTAGQSGRLHLTRTINVSIVADMPDTDPMFVHVVANGGSNNFQLIVSGVETLQFTGTLSAKVDLDTTTTNGTTPKGTSTWNPTTELNRLVRDVTNDRWSFIQADLGGGQAELCNWLTLSQTTGQFTPVSGNTTVGATVQTYTLPTLNAPACITVDGAPNAVPGAVFQKLNFAAQNCIFNGQDGIYQNCKFGSVRFCSGPNRLANCDMANGAAFLYGPATFIILQGGLQRATWGNNSCPAACCVDLSLNVMFRAPLTMNRMGVVRLRNVFFQTVGAGTLINLLDGALLRASASTMCGTGNTGLAFSLSAKCTVSYSGTAVAQFKVASSATPISFNGNTICNAFDAATGLYTAVRALTYANIDAVIATGFGGGVCDPRNGCFFGVAL